MQIRVKRARKLTVVSMRLVKGGAFSNDEDAVSCEFVANYV
jgi:hypothetical protein